MNRLSNQYEKLKEYYGRILEGTRNLKTNACCCNDNSMPPEVRKIVNEIDPEIVERFYGCGSPIPPLLKGRSVLDLGCGTGRDVFVLSKLVGEDGLVVGVDMTEEQLAVARRHLKDMTKKFGYSRENVDFKLGYIEDLKSLGLKDDFFDVVVSNCVINLSKYKADVFREIFRVLKPGGELFFSDVFSGRRTPEHLIDDPVLHGECLSGAMYIEDFRRLLNKLGLNDYRILSKDPITIDNPVIEEKIGMVDFYSLTVRVFKLDDLEDICEDYGQVAVYKGTIPGYPHFFDFDDHHTFISGKPMLVCSNTASMLQHTRFCDHFNIQGNREIHYGPFDCIPAYEKLENPEIGSSGGACC